MRNEKLKILIEGAMMIALATVLAEIKFFELPQGGSITLEMLPIIVFGLRRGSKWGLPLGLLHGSLQLIAGIKNLTYCTTFATVVGCILLDYILAFGLLGLSGFIADMFNNRLTGLTVSGIVCGLFRFVCSWISGFWVWASFYDISGMELVMFSLSYNASYMIADIIIVVIVLLLINKVSPNLVAKQN